MFLVIETDPDGNIKTTIKTSITKTDLMRVNEYFAIVNMDSLKRYDGCLKSWTDVEMVG
jgi:hypothetical protein